MTSDLIGLEGVPPRRPAVPAGADLDLLALTGEPATSTHAVADGADAVLTWDYAKGARPALARLYERAKASMWNAETDLAWDTEVDQERLVLAGPGPEASLLNGTADVAGTALASWGEAEWLQFGIESQNWTLSQFLHGEQGALVCTAKLVASAPWLDAKYFAATQVMDEARHVEVFSRYLDTKLSGHYPVNAHLKALLDDVIADSRWDLTYLGMQIMVEGLALAAFGFIAQLTTEPLLAQILRRVMADEARHVAFGVLSLRDLYRELSAAELRERQEFAYEAAVRMRDRFLQQEVWERMGVDPREAIPLVMASPERQLFVTMLFSRIVPSCRRIGLLDASGGWLRERFGELGVLGFEHLPDDADQAAAYAVADGVSA